MNTKRTSQSYVTTLRAIPGEPGTMRPEDEKELQLLRDNVGIISNTMGQRLRVCVKPRLGRSNPNSWKYSRKRTRIERDGDEVIFTRALQNVRMKDAAYYDVYVYARNPA